MKDWAMRFCGRNFSPEDLALIAEMIEVNPKINRAELSRLFCEKIGWRKRDGGLKEMSCRVAMLKMAREGLIQLPLPRRQHANGNRAIKSSVATDAPSDVLHIANLRNLHVSIVETKIQSQLWNEFIHRYHYLGYKPLPGAQLRYFVEYENVCVALLGFGAAAWAVAPRDNFIGWDREQRQTRLDFIVNNARFLILPWIKCQNLASCVLSLVTSQLANDWEKRYAFRPVLVETFVEDQRYRGTCYKAANWTCVGKTRGRGKLDVKNRYSLPIKSIWLMPLTKKFRQTLCP